MLLMEFHGSPASVQEQAETVQTLASEHGGEAFEWASTPEERTRLWTARHNAFFAAVSSRPGCRAISTDTCVPISRHDADECARAEQLNQALVRRAIRMEGTCTGEHGIGLHKMRFLPEEAGEAALDMMRAIKQALDPHGILNPGKIFD
jgi:D-lactate dehydrogenase (cytochrome)